MKQELPQIDVSEWLEAERLSGGVISCPQPEGSFTAIQYGKATGRSEGRARVILRRLEAAGLATRERWKSGTNGVQYVYSLTKNESNLKKRPSRSNP